MSPATTQLIAPAPMTANDAVLGEARRVATGGDARADHHGAHVHIAYSSHMWPK
jgi:hypothetical protein